MICGACAVTKAADFCLDVGLVEIDTIMEKVDDGNVFVRAVTVNFPRLSHIDFIFKDRRSIYDNINLVRTVFFIINMYWHSEDFTCAELDGAGRCRACRGGAGSDPAGGFLNDIYIDDF